MSNYIPPKEVLEIAVDTLKNMQKKENEWQKTFEEMFDGHFVPQYFNEPINKIIHMIEVLFKDDPEQEYGSTFSWWIYEADFGKKEKFADSVRDAATGENIPMRTVDDLYNYYLKYKLNERTNNGNK